jgi:hypothetical protein
MGQAGRENEKYVFSMAWDYDNSSFVIALMKEIA